METIKEKVHINEIKDGVENREEKVYIIGDKKFWADRTTKANLATHADCVICGKEMLIKYHRTPYKCNDCLDVEVRKEFLKLPLVEWDGKQPLAIYDCDETYFFDSDSLLDYCLDNEKDVSELMLVTCHETKFSQIDVYEQQQEVIHENWEPEPELDKLVTALNDYLSKASTRTWFQDDKRVLLKMEDIK